MFWLELAITSHWNFYLYLRKNNEFSIKENLYLIGHFEANWYLKCYSRL